MPRHFLEHFSVYLIFIRFIRDLDLYLHLVSEWQGDKSSTSSNNLPPHRVERPRSLSVIFCLCWGEKWDFVLPVSLTNTPQWYSRIEWACLVRQNKKPSIWTLSQGERLFWLVFGFSFLTWTGLKEDLGSWWGHSRSRNQQPDSLPLAPSAAYPLSPGAQGQQHTQSSAKPSGPSPGGRAALSSQQVLPAPEEGGDTACSVRCPCHLPHTTWVPLSQPDPLLIPLPSLCPCCCKHSLFQRELHMEQRTQQWWTHWHGGQGIQARSQERQNGNQHRTVSEQQLIFSMQAVLLMYSNTVPALTLLDWQQNWITLPNLSFNLS